MEILFATHNKAKLKLYKYDLEKLGYTVTCLDDLGISDDIEETGNSATENAIAKATGYSKISNCITISVDDSLQLDGVPDAIQPGTHVRRINKEYSASDMELLEYYTDIVNKYGKDGSLTGRWNKCLAIAYPNGDVKYINYSSEKIFVNKIYEKINEGYPLDSISITPKYNKYTAELSDEEKFNIKQEQSQELIDFLKNNL